jgi:uncharacterized integral membrane protein
MVRLIIALPFLIVLVAFALSNTAPVQIGLWPTDFSLTTPLSVAILIAAGVFFFLGALLVWFGTVAARGRARRAEKRVAALESELRRREAMAPKLIQPVPLALPEP